MNEKEIVHLTNTDFELELSRSASPSFEIGWQKQPLCLQLQFLPLLYASSNEVVAVSSMPPEMYLAELKRQSWRAQSSLPKLRLMNEKTSYANASCLPWGSTPRAQHWAEERCMHCLFPQGQERMQMVKHINSKAFSFEFSCLAETALIYNSLDLQHWIRSFPGKKVLKTCFGFSATGHYRTEEEELSDALLRFCRGEWEQNRPLIGEPWLDRLLDFSSQWEITAGGERILLGITCFKTDSKGSYQGTTAGPEELLCKSFSSWVQLHKQAAIEALSAIQKLGFFGFVGIDAFLYRCQKSHLVCLYPVVEINARQTMSRIAQLLQKRYFPDRCIRFIRTHKYTPGTSLLPMELQNANGQKLLFQHKWMIFAEPPIEWSAQVPFE